MSATHHLLKMVKTQARRTSVPQILSLTLYHGATPTHDIIAKLLVSKRAFLSFQSGNYI
jgi:hypothetical protein